MQDEDDGMSKHRVKTANRAALDRGADEQVRRLREILALMAPEAGAPAALGAMRSSGAVDPQKQPQALNAFRR